MLRIALMYANTAAVAGSNLGFVSLYRLLQHHFQVTPVCVSAAGMRCRKGPCRLDDFDLVLLSVSFQNDFVAAFKYLSQLENGARPLVIAGGLAVSMNPLPLLPVVDYAFLGEIESIAPDFVRWLRLPRQALVERLAGESAFVSRETPNRMGNKPPLEMIRLLGQHYRYDGGFCRRPLAAAELMSLQGAHFSAMALLELSRGCPFACPFCYLGNRFRGVRYKHPAEILRVITARARPIKWGLISSCHTRVPQIDRVLKTLINQGHRFSLSSLDLRGDYVPYLAAAKQANIRALTIAPESFASALASITGKHESLAKTTAFLGRCRDYGIGHVKMYFMFGLPGESMEHVAQTVGHLGGLADAFAGIQLSAAFQVFVPKPFTPCATAPIMRYETYRARKRIILTAGKGKKNCRVTVSNYKSAFIDHLISLGGTGVVPELIAGLQQAATQRRFYQSFYG